MKKLLLLLFLLVSLVVTAQVQPGMQLPYIICDDSSNDGFAIFDLTSTIPSILSGVDASVHEVHFYPSETDAVNNTNEINAPTVYINITPGIQVLGIRIINTTTNIIVFSGMNLIVNPLPTANPATLSFCDPNELPAYGLPNADTQITGGAPGVIVTYHETLTDAQTGANFVGPGYFPIVIPVQTLYARVFNPATGCSAITTLTLNTQNCGDPCPTPTNLVATNVTDTSFTVSWANTSGSMGVVAFNVLIVPFGSPTPNESTTGYVTSANPIPFIFTGLSPNACYSVYVKTLCSPTTGSNWSEPLNICMPNCADSGSCSQALILNAFLDTNNNGIKDTGEVDFNYGNFVYQINNTGDNQYGTSNSGSYYIFDSNPSNSYDINFAVNSELGAYYTSSVVYNNITLPSGSGANYLYFPIANIQPHIDTQVTVFPWGQPRPGFTYYNNISFRNNGFQTIANGALTYIKHPSVSIVSISASGTTAISDGFTYNFINLAPFETRNIVVGLSVPNIPTVNLGDLVTNTVTIQTAGDIDLSNNTAVITQAIVVRMIQMI